MPLPQLTRRRAFDRDFVHEPSRSQAARQQRLRAVHALERAVLDAGGVVVRYGRLYGPGTFYEADPPEPPRVHIDQAARRTVALLDTPPGIVDVVD